MSLVSINDVLKITTKVEKIHPYKVVGDRDSYSPYNEGWSDCVSAFWEELKIAQDIVEKVPSAELEDFEWCHDCKEYDQDKHCCHRWTKVIRNTVEEIKTNYWRWIPVTEALPEEEVTVLVSAHYDGDKCYDYKPNDYVTTAEYMDGRWFLSDEEHIMQLHKHHVFAWMPLPEPAKMGDGK